jgi:phosphatidylserine decarboxylase
VGADLSEAELPLDAYPTLNRFFTRAGCGRARAAGRRPRAVASPVDGVAGQVGTVAGGRMVQAKGRWYSVAELLGRRGGGALRGRRFARST